MASKEFAKFKKLLKENNYFVTAPRMRAFGLLQNQPALSTKELIRLMKGFDQTTTYRTVELFEKLGIVTRVQLGWHSKIELSDAFQHHHHHLTCTNCGKVSVLQEDETIERRIRLLSQASGFKPTDHQLEIRGLCVDCRRNT